MKYLSVLSRNLHRDLGYFFIGITLIYALTGFILSARGLGWFKEDYIFKTNLNKNIEVALFHNKLIESAKNGKLNEIYTLGTYDVVEKKIKKLSFEKKVKNTLYFYSKSLQVQYNQTSGEANIKYKAYPAYLQVFISSHLSKDDKVWFYLAMFYSLGLSFLALSSIFMVKGKYGFKRRGIYLMSLGIITIFVFLYFSFV